MALFFYKEKNKDIRAAAYLRLSIEDGDKAESNSIGNQRELIRDFAAERPGLHLIEEYADDGYTGTNFERPGFKRMMLEQEEQKYQTLRRQLYEDMSSSIVSKEEYKEFSHSFNEKVETIRKAKAEMNRQRDCLNNLDVEHLPWIEDFKSYQNLTSLNRRVLVELVESITVYDKEHIHIQYRFDQEIRNVLEYCSSVPAAETEESAV